MENNYTQLCVWQGIIVGEGERINFEVFFEKEMGVRVKYLCEVKTNPDLDENGNIVPETGRRNDVMFYVHNDDIGKFAVPRLSIGIRWWEDVIKYNDGSHLYSKEFIQEHPPTW